MIAFTIEPQRILDASDPLPDSKIRKNRDHPILSRKSKNYDVLYYEKGYICADDEVSPLYRSVVYDSATNNILCAALPKAVSLDRFVGESGMDTPIGDDILVNEIIEGTMINLWFDTTTQQWDISTRSMVGGSYTYYRKTPEDDSEPMNHNEPHYTGHSSFRRMFIEALMGPARDVNAPATVYDDPTLLHHTVESIKTSGGNIMFPRDHFYNFVLQHPENHLVFKIEEPRLYLISMSKVAWQEIEPNVFQKAVDGKYLINTTLVDDSVKEWPEHIWVPAKRILEPGEVLTYRQLAAELASPNDETLRVGYMITHLKMGKRTKIVSETYKQRKEIRGNNPNMLFQYLCLYRVHKITEFLRYFPWYRSMFSRFRKQYVTTMMNIHKSYVARYIKRTGERIAAPYMPHIWRIHHNVFLPSMAAGQKKIVTLQVVQEYFKELSPMQIFYVMTRRVDPAEAVGSAATT